MAARYLVDVTTADGRRRVLTTRANRIVVPGVRPGVLRVRLTGVDRLGRRGPTVVVTNRR